MLEHPEALERWPILGVTLGRPAPADLHPLAVVERLRAAWTGMLDQLVADRPAVVLIEDLHWGEPELVDLLLHGAAAVHGPLLLLGRRASRSRASRPSSSGRSRPRTRGAWSNGSPPSAWVRR